ncbi:BgTH12-06599 [Blumeria graminis f. sp. triticale]|nr:BgTH12-06599 [Blumeria graminis f. sp. triticale]
MSSPNV